MKKSRLRWIPNPLKIDKKSIPKVIIFANKFRHRFLIDFRWIWHPFWEPKFFQNKKNESKNEVIFNTDFNRNLSDLGAQDRPKMPPKSSQDASKMPPTMQHCPQRPPRPHETSTFQARIFNIFRHEF